MRAMPNGWHFSSIADLFERDGGFVSDGDWIESKDQDPNGNVRLIQLADVGEGIFLNKSSRFLTDKRAQELRCCFLRQGDILVARMPDPIGRACIFPGDNKPSITAVDVCILRPPKSVNARWLMATINSRWVRQRVEQQISGPTRQRISRSGLCEIEFLLPPLDEQKEIAAALDSWDVAVKTVEGMLAAKSELKRGLMQQLVAGKTRFNEFVKSGKKIKTRYGDFPEDWAQVHMGDIADEAGKKNGGGRELPVLSCTKHRGLVNSLEYFGKRIFSEDTSTYRIVERGDFAYATNHIEEGSIGYQNLHDAALISPMYTVFRTKPGVDHEFFWKLIKTELYRHIFEVNTSGSIARRGALRWDEFALIKVFLPSVPEQQRIAAVLNTCDAEIKLLEKQLEALKEQKRGLMQKLLTGEIRVKVPKEN